MKRFTTILTISSLLLSLLPIGTAAITHSESDLIKCPDFTSVYYLSPDNKRWVFPNSATFFTWYDDFSTVSTISCEELSEIPVGGLAKYQPGTRMIKIKSDPTVYAVEPNGVLRAIQSELQAVKLFGPDWNLRIDDISDAFIGTYTIGSPLQDNELPDGVIVKSSGSGDHYYVVNGTAKRIPPSSLTATQTKHAITRSEPFEDFSLISSFSVDQFRGISRIDTQNVLGLFAEEPEEEEARDPVPEAPQLGDPGDILLNAQVYTLAWTSVENARSYVLQESEGIFFSNVTEYETTENQIELTKSVDERRSFYYRVKAVNSFGDSEWSSIVDMVIENYEFITAVEDVLQPPTNLLNIADTSNWSIPSVFAAVLEYYDNKAQKVFADGITANNSASSVSNYLGWFMGANGLGSPDRSNTNTTPGVLPADIIPGLQDYLLWDGKSPSDFNIPTPSSLSGKAGNNGFEVLTFSSSQDDDILFSQIRQAVQDKDPMVAVMKYWNPIDLNQEVDGIHFYDWGNDITGTDILNDARLPSETFFNGQGHGLVVVGFIPGYDARDDKGSRKWMIVKDTWTSTPEFIAIPFENYQMFYKIQHNVFQPPLAPSQVNTPSTAFADNSFTFDWEGVRDATHYDVQYSTNQNFLGDAIIVTTAIGASPETTLTLPNAGTYFVHVRSRSPYGISDWSSRMSIAVN